MPAIHGSPISENIDNEFPGIYKNYLIHILLIQTYITTKLSTALKIGPYFSKNITSNYLKIQDDYSNSSWT